MASSAHHHLFLLAFAAMLASASTPRAGAWSGARLFFSKTTRPQDEKAAAGAVTVVPDANSATVFSRPSTYGGSGRGYGLYGRPEENFPPGYFRRGVHRNAEKLTTVPTPSAAVNLVGGRREGAVRPLAEDNGSGRGRPPWTSTQEAVAVGGGGESTEAFVEDDDGSGRGRPPWTSTGEAVAKGGGGESTEAFVEDDDGSGRGRPSWTNTNVPSASTEETTVRMGGSRGRVDRAEPFVEEGDGSGRGRGRAPWFYGPNAERRPEEQRDDYGMSDTRLYQNGRYYYDVNAGRYGHGPRDESNLLVRARHGEFGGSGDRRGWYGNAAASYQYGNGNEFGNRMVNGFQEEEQTGRYIP